MKIPKNFKTTEEAFGFREAISTPLLPVEVPLDQATPLHHAYKIRILSGHPISSLREVAGLCGWLIVLWRSGSSEEKVPGRTPMETLLEGKKLYADLEEYQPLPISLPRV